MNKISKEAAKTKVKRISETEDTFIEAMRTVGSDAFLKSLAAVDRAQLSPEILTVLDAFEPTEYPSLSDFVDQGYLSPEELQLIQDELLIYRRPVLLVGPLSDTMQQLHASISRILAERDKKVLLLETDDGAFMHLLPRLLYNKVESVNHRVLPYAQWLMQVLKTDATSFSMYYAPLSGLDDFSMASLIDRKLPGVIFYLTNFTVDMLQEQWGREQNSQYVAEQVNFKDMLTVSMVMENKIPGLVLSRSGSLVEVE